MVKSIEESETAGIQAEYAERSAALQQQFESGIISQEQYNSEKEQLDHDQRNSELEVQKKYADANFAMQVAQIGIATATGIVSAWASSMMLGPIAGPIAAGVMTALLVATAAAQIATANAERKRVKSLTLGSSSSGGSKSTQPKTGSVVLKDAPGGFADGGYTGAGGKYEVAGFLPDGRAYHRGEYFVAQEEMMHPEVVPLVRRIENIRQRRTRKNPLPDSFADGGYTAPSPLLTVNDDLIGRFEKAIEKLGETKLESEINYWEWKKVEENMNKAQNFAKK